MVSRRGRKEGGKERAEGFGLPAGGKKAHTYPSMGWLT
jgi:hypothetical protein